MTPRWLQSFFWLTALVTFVWWGVETHRRVQAKPTQKVRTGPAHVGSAVPRLQLLSPKGEEVNLHTYRGQWILLNFWATWCEPCRHEMPSMERLARKFRNQHLPIVVLAASVDASWRVIRRFFQTHPTLRRESLHMQLAWDQGMSNALRFGTSKYPETYLISPSGQLQHKFIGPREWDTPKMVSTLKRLTQTQRHSKSVRK